MIARAGIALGSNLGNRLEHLERARDLFRKVSVAGEPFLEAGVYQTAPVACPDGSPDFYNTVIEFGFEGTALELLSVAHSIESELGRVRGAERNLPRTLDADLLYLGNLRISSEELELPHPRLTERRFVLVPLDQIRPELILPGDTQSISDHLRLLSTAEPDLIPVPGT